jgi:hypothetical protein
MMNEQRNTLSQYLADLSVFILFSGLIFFGFNPKNQSNESFGFLEAYFTEYSSNTAKNHCFAISKPSPKLPSNHPESIINHKFEKYFSPFSVQIITQDLSRKPQNPLDIFLDCLFANPIVFFETQLFTSTYLQLTHYQHFALSLNKGWQIFAYLNAIPRLAS